MQNNSVRFHNVRGGKASAGDIGTTNVSLQCALLVICRPFAVDPSQNSRVHHDIFTICSTDLDSWDVSHRVVDRGGCGDVMVDNVSYIVSSVEHMYEKLTDIRSGGFQSPLLSLGSLAAA